MLQPTISTCHGFPMFHLQKERFDEPFFSFQIIRQKFSKITTRRLGTRGQSK